MKLSLLRYFAWISLVCVVFFGCSSSWIILSNDEAQKMRESFLSSSFEKITCKAKVTFHENEISGMMLIKKTEDGNYKLAFYNELGMTYLEGTLEGSLKYKKLIIKNIVPALSHKSFIKGFEKSMQIVFSNQTIPTLHALMPSSNHESTLKIQLHNGFILELSPQITQINTD